jgi:hypothetical protein
MNAKSFIRACRLMNALHLHRPNPSTALRVKSTNLPYRQAGKSRLQFSILKTWQNVVIVRMAITALGHAPLPVATPFLGFATTKN